MRRGASAWMFFGLVMAHQATAVPEFEKQVQPIVAEFCFDCHGDGMNKGKVTLDEFKSEQDAAAKPDLWLRVLKNVRAGLMPPEKKPQPSAEQMRTLETWIKHAAFGIDPANPDPGRITIRRLNRVEYRNTIRDLMGYDFKAYEEFPPDDSGYGFDNIGDVLTVSPLLLEKYLQAAETIVANAVPTVSKVVDERVLTARDFSGSADADRMSFYNAASVTNALQIQKPGSYRMTIALRVDGAFDFDPGQCRLVFKLNDRELLNREFGWDDNKLYRFEFDEKWQPGPYHFAVDLQPMVPPEKKKTSVDMRLESVRVDGPLEKEHWVHPKNYERFFPADESPTSRSARKKYAREVLKTFASKGYRRPVDDATLARLVQIAEDNAEGKRFEEGVARAMVAVLASPRFIFRVEETEPVRSAKTHPYVDEYSLASRLSYFLWSTTPDEELMRLAERKQLRKNLAAEVQRMLADRRSEALIENFTGQWLQVRDVEGIAIDGRMVLARDRGEDRELKRQIEEFRARIQQARATRQTNAPFVRPRFFNAPNLELDGELRRAMQLETQMYFAHVVRDDRSVLELVDSDYTFLNGRLAKHYGMTNITGKDTRKVTLPEGDPRGGVLTHASVLTVTSNPTRTSPVKRGLFLLENFLGTPPPPPPADIPDLEESEKKFADHEPTLREILEQHRSNALCSSCHSRMDPLGLAFENFNALAMWRDKERNQPIEVSGRLITGEKFSDIRELKRILATERRMDFYRCLTEKLLTYALGRGLEYRDVHAVDEIVERLEREQGRFSALLMGIIESAPFQKQRNPAVNVTAVRSTQSSKEEVVQ
jgi:hypothetical protein